MKTIVFIFFIFFVLVIFVMAMYGARPRRKYTGQLPQQKKRIITQELFLQSADATSRDVFCWVVDDGKVKIVSQNFFENFGRKNYDFSKKNAQKDGGVYYTEEDEKYDFEYEKTSQKTLPHPSKEGQKDLVRVNANANSIVMDSPLANGKELVKVCKTCFKPLKGERSSKQFCDSYCKREYHK